MAYQSHDRNCQSEYRSTGTRSNRIRVAIAATVFVGCASAIGQVGIPVAELSARAQERTLEGAKAWLAEFAEEYLHGQEREQTIKNDDNHFTSIASITVTTHSGEVSRSDGSSCEQKWVVREESVFNDEAPDTTREVYDFDYSLLTSVRVTEENWIVFNFSQRIPIRSHYVYRYGSEVDSGVEDYNRREIFILANSNNNALRIASAVEFTARECGADIVSRDLF